MSKTFGDRLKTARDVRGWNQGELAEATGLQVSAISHFETGTRSPSFDNLRKLADALQVTTDYLIGRSDSPDLSNETAGKLFRKAGKLTAKDLEFLEQMADELAKRNKQ
jgi:transcriptional regulator with XRE-family HTH domain